VELGADPSWAKIDDARAQIHNSDGTGACDAARREVAAVLSAAAEADARMALALVHGACYSDFDAQAACEAGCATMACPPGTIETRCEAAALSVQCHAACDAGGLCVGTPERPASCIGRCESECQGQCRGSCIAADGSVSRDDPDCQGKCSSSCNGSCHGICQLEEPIDCGDAVSCRGGCTGDYRHPRCTSEYLPPPCDIPAACYASCAAQATANAECELPRVAVYADAAAMTGGRMEVLTSTLEANLPFLVVAAETQGPGALASIQRLANAAYGLAGNSSMLDRESRACARAAAEVSFETAATIDASRSAALRVLNTCYGQMG
jgi:hypothetical protein